MNYIKIYSDLQINPKDFNVYKKLIRYYEDKNPQLCTAFKELLEAKSEFNNTSADQE